MGSANTALPSSGGCLGIFHPISSFRGAQHNRQGKQGRRQTERWARRRGRGSLAAARSRFPSSSRCSHRPVPCGWAARCPRGSPPPAPRRPLDLPGPAAPSLQPQPDFPRRPRARFSRRQASCWGENEGGEGSGTPCPWGRGSMDSSGIALSTRCAPSVPG